MWARGLAMLAVVLLVGNAAEGAEPRRVIKSTDALYLARLIVTWLGPKTEAERALVSGKEGPHKGIVTLHGVSLQCKRVNGSLRVGDVSCSIGANAQSAERSGYEAWLVEGALFRMGIPGDGAAGHSYLSAQDVRCDVPLESVMQPDPTPEPRCSLVGG